LRPAQHPITGGRRSSFDAITFHQDELVKLPEGATMAAGNDHSAVQALAYDRDGVSFWGTQYHPECGLAEIAFLLRTSALLNTGLKRGLAHDLGRIAEDPGFHARLCAKHRIGLDILDRRYHMTELANWLSARVSTAR
jgi:GMP synthase (glutamine-hydrolysing)